jgi:hypothetical protein
VASTSTVLSAASPPPGRSLRAAQRWISTHRLHVRHPALPRPPCSVLSFLVRHTHASSPLRPERAPPAQPGPCGTSAWRAGSPLHRTSPSSTPTSACPLCLTLQTIPGHDHYFDDAFHLHRGARLPPLVLFRPRRRFRLRL